MSATPESTTTRVASRGFATAGVAIALAWSLAGSLAGDLAAQSGQKAAVRQCKKTFRVKPPGFKPRILKIDAPPLVAIDAWAKARFDDLAALGRFHDAGTAKSLLRFSLQIERDLISVDTRRQKLKKAIAAAYPGYRAAVAKAKKDQKLLTVASPGIRKYEVLSQEAGYFRAMRDGHEACATEIRSQAMQFDPAATREALAAVIGDTRQPLSLKVAITRRAAGFGDAMLEPLIAALGDAKKPGEVAAVVKVLGGYKGKARPVADRLIELIGDADAGVREHAALALSQIAVPAAIEPMIGLLARERGLAQKRIAAALEILTRQQFGLRVSAWQRWFAAEGAAYASGAKELGGGKPSTSEEYNEKNYYYGIRQDGKSILYILDCSGSMMVSYANPKFSDKERRQPLPARAGEISRLDACRKRLSEAIGRLTSEQKFNIIWYSFEPSLYKKKMQPATPKNKAAAQAFLKTLNADGATNIYDTMQLAFEATGRGSYDKAYSVDCDMIFMLTDGKPTLAGRSQGLDMVESILSGVRKWNALDRITIHTIGIGKELNTEFLSKLASENGGEFRDGEGHKRGASAEEKAGTKGKGGSGAPAGGKKD